jgi:dynein heavy chain 1
MMVLIVVKQMVQIQFNLNFQLKQLMQHKKGLGKMINISIKIRIDLFLSVALIKITPTIDMDKKISQQIHFTTFTNRAPAEIFRTFLSQAMTPYLKSFLRQQKER